MRSLRLALFAMSAFLSVAAMAAEPCRYFDPAIETLTGRIEARSVDFGEPIPYMWGHRIHHFQVVVLDRPICVINLPSTPVNDVFDEFENVTEIYLRWSPMPSASHWLGRVVTVSGRLNNGPPARPYADVGIRVHEARAEGGKGKGRNRTPLEWRDPHPPTADTPPGKTTPTEGAPRATPPAPRPQPPGS